MKAFCLLYSVWIIDDYKGHGNRFKILIKLNLAQKYDIKLKDWDIDYISNVKYTYSKIFRGINIQIQILQYNIPDEQQQFEETGFQTQLHQISKEPLPNLSPYLYHCHKFQTKQDELLFSQ